MIDIAVDEMNLRNIAPTEPKCARDQSVENGIGIRGRATKGAEDVFGSCQLFSGVPKRSLQFRCLEVSRRRTHLTGHTATPCVLRPVSSRPTCCYKVFAEAAQVMTAPATASAPRRPRTAV